MPGISRQGDLYGPGGVIGAPVSPNVIVNGRPVALNGARYTAHPCCGARGCPPAHCGGSVFSSAAVGARVIVNGSYPIVIGDNGACGHNVKTGSFNVIAGN
jgi:uncharacterized Zn-binding protein involved in type VI secretion